MIIIHAVNTEHILPRVLQGALDFALRSFPVVVLTGSRQTGKSTLVRRLSGDAPRTYRTLDDLGVLERAREQPELLVRSAERMTLDEVQRSPDLLLAVKRVVDEGRTPGQFLLTSSANLLLMQKISETLAGRATYLTLWPLTRREQLGLGAAGVWSRLFEVDDSEWRRELEAEDAPREDWRSLAPRGGYPSPALELTDPEARTLWFDGYTRTYLERDLQELSSVTSLVDFRRLMRAARLRLASSTPARRSNGLPKESWRRRGGRCSERLPHPNSTSCTIRPCTRFEAVTPRRRTGRRGASVLRRRSRAQSTMSAGWWTGSGGVRERVMVVKSA